ncbi:MAG: hypothetical protein MZU97_15590 [Bacillus subtilis]|nr:hypothetical protein [Bacillus subtilis]
MGVLSRLVRRRPHLHRIDAHRPARPTNSSASTLQIRDHDLGLDDPRRESRFDLLIRLRSARRGSYGTVPGAFRLERIPQESQ